MTGIALPHPSRRLRAGDAALLAAAAVHATLVVAWVAGLLPAHAFRWVAAAPLLTLPLALRRTPLSRPQVTAVILLFCGSGALLMAAYLPFFWRPFLVVPGLAVAGVLAARFPVFTILVAFLVTGSFGSLTAFWGYPGAPTVDVCLGGLWVAAIWGWSLRRDKAGTAWLWPGVACLLLYVLLTAAEVLTAESLTVGLQAFRASVWYLSALVLVGYAPWPEGARRTITRGAILVAAAVGAYATYRWLAGPAQAERDFASQNANNFLDSELRLTGSFATGKELVVWAAAATPFCTGFALSTRSVRWRAAAVGAIVVLLIAMLAADVRAGPAALAPALLVVLAIRQLNPAFGPGRHVVTAIAVALVVGGGAAAFALTLGGKGDTGSRYEAILHPGRDASYQARLFKWRTALTTIDEHPFGQGLGTSGRTAQRYGRFQSISTIEVDNSYLKIALEQGFAVMVFFGLGLVLLLAGLVKRALTEPDRERAGVAAGACGTLVALAILFYVAVYIEGLPALAGWVLVGLGVSQVSRSLDRPGVA